MKREMILPVLLSFGISLALGPVLIPFLRKVKAGQKEREEGVPSHQKKAGTPTMGGVMFLAAFTAVSLLFRKEGAEVVPVLFLTLGFGLIGFLDDYLKVVLHRSDGLYPKQKMALQAVITAVFLWYLARFSGISLRMRIPFLPGKELDAGIFTIPFLAFVILGTVNGVNFTDGLDGLAASVTILNAVFFSVASIGLGNGVSPSSACGYRESAGVSGIQCISCPRLYGRYRKSGTRRFRLGNGVFLTSPLISAACGIHLYDGDSLCDPAGVILQTDEGKTDLQDDADPSPFRADGLVGDTDCDGVCYNHSDIMPDRIDGALKYGGNQT